MFRYLYKQIKYSTDSETDIKIQSSFISGKRKHSKYILKGFAIKNYIVGKSENYCISVKKIHQNSRLKKINISEYTQDTLQELFYRLINSRRAVEVFSWDTNMGRGRPLNA